MYMYIVVFYAGYEGEGKRDFTAVPLHREERNTYARQLLQMLKSGKLSHPFTTPPPLAGLPPLSPHERGLERGGEASVLGSGGGGPPTERTGSPLLLASHFHPQLTSSLLVYK